MKNRSIKGYLLALLPMLLLACGEQQHEFVEDRMVDETRFTKVQLAGDLDEPMEIAITSENNVVIVERKGAVKFYDATEQSVSLVHNLRVFSGLEDGLLGVALDPDHNTNHFIYFFYSPPGDEPKQRVSRFTFRDNKLDTLSEKIIIEIPTQRVECCHSAGSLAFGTDRELFIAVGDNTNPHNPGYYNSIDEREGRAYWDAQRTAGNTNDLRGKILRIRIEPDGTYTIPKGNLFAPNDSLARPEIYAMGCRNPYRISYDSKRNWLFWGDVGQNTIDNPARGPISYDEWHVATEAGFFGWPYFAGPNAPYADFDFETEEIGPFFQVDQPVNASVNNTGRRVLPPAKGAMIWYSYDESKEFEHLGTGGKSPIAGPVFYANLYNNGIRNENSVSLPNYYDGKLFIAEWLRDWVNVVSLTPDAKVEKIEPFMRGTTFSHPIELELGPEGALYVLEYGPNWFSKNKEAALYRIGYVRGNRPPVVKLVADKVVGATPLTVNFSSEGTFDPDSGSQLKYEWYFGEEQVHSREPNAVYTFSEKGIYSVKLVVTDEKGKATTVTEEVRAGNDMPVVTVVIEGNQSFYWDNKPIPYKVQVNDKEDGSTDQGAISENNVAVNLTYSTMGTDLTLVEQSEDLFTSSALGWQLMQDSDCKACHAINEKSIGPTYLDIAARYPNEKNNVDKLARKIITGGSGVWGENVMSAHPQLSADQAREMVSFILSLKNDAQATRPLPIEGSFSPDAHVKDKSAGDYILTVSYKDKVVNGIGPNTVRERLIWRHPEVNAVTSAAQQGATKSGSAIAFTEDQAWILFKDIDLTDIRSVSFHTSAHQAGGTLTVRASDPRGEELARVNVDKDRTMKKQDDEATLPWKQSRSTFKPTKGKRDLYVVFEQDINHPVSDSTAFFLRSLRFNP